MKNNTKPSRVLIYNPAPTANPAFDKVADGLAADILCTSRLESVIDLIKQSHYDAILHPISEPRTTLALLSILTAPQPQNGKFHRPPIIGVTSQPLEPSDLAELYSAGIAEILPLMPAQSLGLKLQTLLNRTWHPDPYSSAIHMRNRRARRTNSRFPATEMERARARTFEPGDEKSRFLGNMSHELRTPLNAILGYAEMIREDLSNERTNDACGDAEHIIQAGKHLLAVINNVLALSQTQNGLLTLSLSEFDVKPLVEQVASALTLLAGRRGNTIRINCCPSCSSIVLDELKVRLILFNLMSNAVKFTHNGEITVSICCTGQTDHDSLCVTVRDTGIGIPSEVMPRLFHDFMQGDDSPTRTYGGAGVGLSLIRRYTELMGGSVAVESQPGIGSTFMVILPARATGYATPQGVPLHQLG